MAASSRTSDLRRQVLAEVAEFRRTGKIPESLNDRIVSCEGLEYIPEEDRDALVDAALEDDGEIAWDSTVESIMKRAISNLKSRGVHVHDLEANRSRSRQGR
jgi:hypothetical protein